MWGLVAQNKELREALKKIVEEADNCYYMHANQGVWRNKVSRLADIARNALDKR